jgi:hypothetical protein
VNLSLGVYWKKQFGRLPMADSADSSVANSAREQFEIVISNLRTAGHYPPFVVASGDDGINAFWSGLPAAKLDADYAEQIVVVGSNNNNSSANGTRSSSFNNGSLVDIVAPGNNVGVLNKSGTVTTSFSGTSLSAPFVTGRSRAGRVLRRDAGLRHRFDDDCA